MRTITVTAPAGTSLGTRAMIWLILLTESLLAVLYSVPLFRGRKHPVFFLSPYNLLFFPRCQRGYPFGNPNIQTAVYLVIPSCICAPKLHCELKAFIRPDMEVGKAVRNRVWRRQTRVKNCTGCAVFKQTPRVENRTRMYAQSQQCRLCAVFKQTTPQRRALPYTRFTTV